VSDRVQAQQQARRLQRSLNLLARRQTVGEVSTALAHEINQPLTAIANYAHAARRQFETPAGDPAETARLLSEIESEAGRAGEIIKRMRRLIDHGKVDLSPEDINEVLVEAVHLSEAGQPHDAINVVYDLEDGLPKVMVDRIQIQQVVINLIRNAAEAMADIPSNTVTIETALQRPAASLKIRAARDRDENVLVTVSDEGPGIPSDRLEDIFEPFATTRTDGLGVGLAICRSIVKAHGGRIWAENRPDHGASIHFTIPVAPR